LLSKRGTLEVVVGLGVRVGVPCAVVVVGGSAGVFTGVAVVVAGGGVGVGCGGSMVGVSTTVVERVR